MVKSKDPRIELKSSKTSDNINLLSDTVSSCKNMFVVNQRTTAKLASSVCQGSLKIWLDYTNFISIATGIVNYSQKSSND